MNNDRITHRQHGSPGDSPSFCHFSRAYKVTKVLKYLDCSSYKGGSVQD